MHCLSFTGDGMDGCEMEMNWGGGGLFLWRGWWRNITDWVAVAWLVGVLDGRIVEHSRQSRCWMGCVCFCFLSIELFFGAGEETRKGKSREDVDLRCPPSHTRCRLQPRSGQVQQQWAFVLG